MKPGDNRRVWATHTWEDNWSNVIRRVIFKDKMLLDMMMVPENKRRDVIEFSEKFFVNDAMPDALIINEDVRIVYAEMEGASMNIPQMRRRHIAFDIYVKREHQNTYSNDGLLMRDRMIARRLRYLLTRNRDTQGLVFTAVDDMNLGSKTVGYNRYHLLMSYIKTY